MSKNKRIRRKEKNYSGIKCWSVKVKTGIKKKKEKGFEWRS